MSSGGSQASSSDYDALRGNLEKSLSVNTTLKKNNDIIRKRYAAMKEKVQTLEKQCQEATTQMKMAIQGKEAVERDCEALYKRWNDHVKQQQSEFQQIQSQMVPSRELEMLRIQMAEELEFPHRQQIEALTAELGKFREAYHQEHRMLELSKIQLAQTQEEHAKIVDSIQRSQAKKIENLTEKNASLQELVEDTTTLDELREAQRNNADLLFRQKQLNNELLELRAERDEALSTVDEIKAVHSKALKRAEGQLIESQQETKNIQKQYDDVLHELAASSKTRSELQAKVIGLERVKLAFHDKMESKQRELEFVTDSTDKRVADVKLACEKKLDQLTDALTESQKQLGAATHAKQDCLTKLKYADRERDILVKQAREEEASKYRQARNEVENLTKRATELEDMFTAKEQKLQNTIDRKAEELDLLKADVLTLREEISSLRSINDDHKLSLSKMRGDHDNKHKELEALQGEYESLQAKYRALLQEENAASVVRDKLLEEKNVLIREAEATQMEIESERRVHLEALQKARADLEKERREIRGHIDKLSSGSVISAEEARKLKKDKNKYKQMSLKLRNRTETLLVEVAEQQNNKGVLVDSKAKNKLLTDQITHLEQENSRLSEQLRKVHAKHPSTSHSSAFSSDAHVDHLRGKLRGGQK